MTEDYTITVWTEDDWTTYHFGQERDKCLMFRKTMLARVKDDELTTNA